MEIAGRECGEGDPGVEIQLLSVFKSRVRVGDGLGSAEEKVETCQAMLVKQSLRGGLYGINRIWMMFAKFFEA